MEPSNNDPHFAPPPFDLMLHCRQLLTSWMEGPTDASKVFLRGSSAFMLLSLGCIVLPTGSSPSATSTGLQNSRVP